VSLLLVVGLVVQGIAPLRKSDLVRLLSGSAIIHAMVTLLVRSGSLAAAR
jgi:hypothetical protein